MARLTLTLLGSPRVTLDGAPLTFTYHKVAALLIYLAVESRHPHSRATLAALLWPDIPERSARQSLSQALTTLRVLLGERAASLDQPPFLHADSDTLQLNPAADWQLDVEQFQLLLSALPAHQHRALRTCVVCAERLERRTAIYQGNFLDQFALRDSAPFDEWALVWRVRLREDALQALAQLADIAEWREQYGQALDYTQRQITLDPLREESHRAHMRLLALSGQPAAASAHYDQLAHTLARELELTPEQPTLLLREHIRSAGNTTSTLRRYQPPPAHVPARPTPLIGRAADLDTLRQLLLHDAQRLITIVGPPGIGKTSLAQIVTAGARFDFVDGVAFVELASLVEAELVAATIMQALEIAEHAGEDVAATLTAMLSQRHMLLTLDNFEQLPQAAPLVELLLNTCPALSVLVTSRAPLALDGEYVYPLDTLTLPQPDDSPAAIARATAVQLFVERACAVDPNFVLIATNADAIAAICARLDGLPLAIELIAAQADRAPPDELLRQLEPRLATLVDGPRDLPERQRTLHNAISWSFNLLNPQEQRVFAWLGVFTGGCTAEALGAILADAPTAAAILPRLQHASLIQLQPAHDPPRYLMLESIRAYAYEMLTRTGSLADVQTRHAFYYAQLVETNKQRAQLVAEYENLLAAVAWTIERELAAATLQLGVGLAQIWLHNRSWVNGLLWLETVFARRAAHANPRSSRSRAAQSTKRLQKAAPPAQYQHLQAWVEQQLLRAEQQGDAQLQRLTWLALALVRQAQGRYAETQQLLERVIAGAVTATNRFPMALLAELYARTQQHAQAYALYTTCVQLNRDCADREGTADALAGLAQIACVQRSLDAAAAFGQATLAIYASLDHQHGIARLLCVLGTITYAQGDPIGAIAQYCRSFIICDQLHDTAGRADVFEALAPILAELRRSDLVVRVISAAATLRRSDGTHLTPAEQTQLDQLRADCVAQLGQPAFEQHWHAAQSVLDAQLLALIEHVRRATMRYDETR